MKYFLGIFLEDIFGGFFSTEFFWWNFLGRFFWEDFFGRIFLGGNFWEDFWENFFGRNSTKSYLNIEGIDLFVKILYLRKGRKEEENLNL